MPPIVITDNDITGVMLSLLWSPTQMYTDTEKLRLLQSAIGFYYHFFAFTKPWRMRSGSDYVTSRFVLEPRREYEHLTNDLLRKDDNQF
jgi:hypothetical protein